MFFGPPPSVPLPTAAAFGRLEVPAARQLHRMNFDLVDAFYQVELPPEYSAYPGLPVPSWG